MMIEGALAVLIGLLLGSIPFGLILTRAAGLGDIREIGSGSIGATNVLRTGRKGLAAATTLLDALKGTVSVWLAAWLLGAEWGAMAGVAAVISHCHPVWLGFKGGKGVATAFGVMLGLSWPVLVIAALTWLAAAKLSKISSVGGLSAVAVAPIAAIVFSTPSAAVALLGIAGFVAWRHKSNIERLRAGTEPRIGQGK